MASAIKILVTGADGCIGSHLTEELIRQGQDAHSFVMYNPSGMPYEITGHKYQRR